MQNPEQLQTLLQQRTSSGPSQLQQHEQQHSRQPPPPPPPASSAEQAKAAGNKAFAAGDYSEASSLEVLQWHREGMHAGVSTVWPHGSALVQSECNTLRRQQFEQALQQYSKALELEPQLMTARNNRALAHLKLRHFDAAESDANAVLQAQPGNVKALLRRADARFGCIHSCTVLLLQEGWTCVPHSLCH